MGCYVNPPEMEKEVWLIQNGELTDKPCPITESHLPVCLVDNGLFSAAGVAYDKQEVEEFSSSKDPRYKLWFKVSRDKLRLVSDLSKYEERIKRE